MQRRMETQFFIWLLILVSIAFIWVLAPFFAAVFWAIAIAIIFRSPHKWLLRKIPRWPNLAALLTLFACVIIVVIPTIFTVASVVDQGRDVYQKLEDGEINLEEYIRGIGDALPALQNWLDQSDVDIANLRERIAESVMKSGSSIAQGTFNIGQNVFVFVLKMGVMLYVAFFLLRDADKLVDLLQKALPLGEQRERLLFSKFAEVTRATIKGNIIIAIVEGGLGGFIFWILGIPGALLWAVVMAILSLIPAVGAGLVWVPVAVFMIITGEYIQAIILIAFGSIVIGLVDNFLRPILVGRDTKLPDYLVLLSTLGGLVLFGFNGFVIGPLIAALFTVVWGIFMREFQHEDTTGISRDLGNGDA